MPVTWSIEGDLVRMNFEGHYEPKDIIDSFEAALTDPRCPEEFFMLVDATKSESLGKRSPSDIRYVAEYLGPYRNRIHGRVAVVARSGLHFGLSRMGSAYSDNVGVTADVFLTIPEALEWLRSGKAPPESKNP